MVEFSAPTQGPAGPPRRAWACRCGITVMVAFGVVVLAVNAIQRVVLIEANGGIETFRSLAPGQWELPFALTLVSMIGIAIAGIGSVVIVGMPLGRLTLIDLGFRRVSWQWLLGAVGLALPLGVVRIAAAWAMSALFPRSGEAAQTITRMVSHSISPLAIVLSVLLVSGLVPLWEEIFFRGFLYQWLRERLSCTLAVALGAAIFALFHLDPAYALSAFIFGVAAALLFECSGSLWTPIALHVTGNLIGQMVAYVS